MLNFMNYVTPPPNTMAPWNLTIFSTNTCKMCIFQCELPLLQWVHAFHGYLTLCFHDHYTWVIEPIFAWKSLSKGQLFHNLSRGPHNSYDSKHIATWRSCQSSFNVHYMINRDCNKNLEAGSMDFNISLIKPFTVMQIFAKKIIFRVLIMNLTIYVYFPTDDMQHIYKF